MKSKSGNHIRIEEIFNKSETASLLIRCIKTRILNGQWQMSAAKNRFHPDMSGSHWPIFIGKLFQRLLIGSLLSDSIALNCLTWLTSILSWQWIQGFFRVCTIFLEKPLCLPLANILLISNLFSIAGQMPIVHWLADLFISNWSSVAVF